MNVGIVGTGAMAALFAARLHSVAGVVMVGSWREQIDAINRTGLTVIELDGRETRHRLRATDNPAGAAPVDAALVLTKSYQTIEAVARVAAMLAADGVVVTLQNGIGNVEQFAAAFGRNQVTAGVTTQGATLLSPGHLRHTGNGTVALAVQRDAPAQLHDFATVLAKTSIQVTLIESVDALLWSKVAINAGINPLTALLGVPNGTLAADNTLRAIMIAAAREAAAVAAALNVTLTYDDVSIELVRVAEATAINRSSMLQDVMRGAPTEIDAICGEIVKIGRKHGVPTPLNAAFYDAIIALESGTAAPIALDQLQSLANSLQ